MPSCYKRKVGSIPIWRNVFFSFPCSGESGEHNVLTVGLLCLPCYKYDTRLCKKKMNDIHAIFD